MITNRQKYVISIIERNLNINFTGNNFQEARNFISKNIEDSKLVSKEVVEFRNLREELYDYYDVR